MRCKIEVEIPRGKTCKNCKFVDGEFEFCHLFQGNDYLTLGCDNKGGYLKCNECLSLIKSGDINAQKK